MTRERRRASVVGQARSFTLPTSWPTRNTSASGGRRRRRAIRTVLGVPLLREGNADRRLRSGTRQVVRPFTDKQIELVDHLRRPGGDRHRERRGCSTRCRQRTAISPSRWSSRPRPPRCSRSSPARPASCSRCSRPCWRTRPRICEAKFGTSVVARRQMAFAPARFTVICPPAFAEQLQRDADATDLDRTSRRRASSRRRRPSTSRTMQDEPSTPPRRPAASTTVDIAGARSLLVVPHAQGGRADRRRSPSTARGAAVHRQADRAGDRTSPRRP